MMEKLEEPLRRVDVDAPGDETSPEVASRDDEHWRLAGRAPLKTLLILTAGPLASQLVTAMNAVINTIWMGKAVGDDGVSALSVFSNIDNIGRHTGTLFLTAATAKLPNMYGSGRAQEAGQVICDLLRCCFIAGVIVPAVLCPIARPLANWFGVSDAVTDLATKYIYPLLGASTVTCAYLLACGILIAEGRSLLVGAIQIGSIVCNMCVFNPLFLLGFHWRTIGAAFATIICEFVPATVILLLLFRGKFEVKADWRGLFRRFHSETKAAISLGVSAFMMGVSRSIPSTFLRRFMGMAARNGAAPDADRDKVVDDVQSGFTAVIRVFGVCDAFRVALSTGLLPPLSYANAAGLWNRVLWLLGHATWLNLAFSAVSFVPVLVFVKDVVKIFSTSPNYLRWAAPMVVGCNWETPYVWMRNQVQAMLQASQRGRTATLYSLLGAFVAYMVALVALYYTKPTDPVRLMLVMPIQSAVGAVLAVPFLWAPGREFAEKWREAKDAEEPPLPAPDDVVADADEFVEI